jgi:Phosphate transporter family
MNGFHDAANSIATVVSTGVLKPAQAVAFAAFFNLVAIFIFELKVAATIGKGIVQPGVVDHYVVFGALIGATACAGFKTPVETTVAMEFAASWKPFMKSKTIASATSSAITQNATWIETMAARAYEFSRTTPSTRLATSSQRSVIDSNCS